jgi:hypothetical protein
LGIGIWDLFVIWCLRFEILNRQRMHGSSLSISCQPLTSVITLHFFCYINIVGIAALRGSSQMTEAFQPGAAATLIGSLPLADHGAAADLILKHTPEIPFWAQLPVHEQEGMLARFSKGLPGLCQDDGNLMVNTEKGNFAQSKKAIAKMI